MASRQRPIRILDRRVFPFGLAISAEPEWRRHSETSGNREDAYGVELKVYADKEWIPDRVFTAVNVLFEPEAIRVKDFDPDLGFVTTWERESTFGVSGAIAGAVAPGLFLGAEVRYLSQFEGSFLNRFAGNALFVGRPFPPDFYRAPSFRRRSRCRWLAIPSTSRTAGSIWSISSATKLARGSSSNSKFWAL